LFNIDRAERPHTAASNFTIHCQSGNEVPHSLQSQETSVWTDLQKEVSVGSRAPHLIRRCIA